MSVGKLWRLATAPTRVGATNWRWRDVGTVVMWCVMTHLSKGVFHVLLVLKLNEPKAPGFAFFVLDNMALQEQEQENPTCQRCGTSEPGRCKCELQVNSACPEFSYGLNHLLEPYDARNCDRTKTKQIRILRVYCNIELYHEMPSQVCEFEVQG
jgi:hypothetical protein